MEQSNPPPVVSGIYKPSKLDEPLRQGEIITNLLQFKLDLQTINTESVAGSHAAHPYAIVVSQDCDLDWDYRARQKEAEAGKIIPNILFCEVTTAQQLLELVKSSEAWKRISQNKDERYHFLQKVKSEEDILREGLPELGVDFKRYFTLPSDEIYFRIQLGEAKRRCRFVSPYLEHFSARFAYFQSRIALPEDHYSEPKIKK